MSGSVTGQPGLKRQASRDSISPPPLKRREQTKIQSSTTQNAVASFFTPISQKPPEKVKWHERARDDEAASTLLVGRLWPDGRPKPGQSPCKIAAFDFDSTLISTRSGKKFGDAQDWKWWNSCVPAVLKKLHDDGYIVAILSNQGGIALKADPKIPKVQQTRVNTFKSKATVVLSQLNIPISLYAATERDIFRKPRTGMWTELLEDYDITSPGAVDLTSSFFVGDAAGRLEQNANLKADFSCSDRNLADNIGIQFMTPEEYFLKEEPRPFLRLFEPSNYIERDEAASTETIITKTNEQDIVLFCGSPGAGKSTTYWKILQPLGYERVNQDILKTRDRCLKAAEDYLLDGRSVVIDREVRSKWTELAKRHKIPIRCVLFAIDERLCEHNNAVRALNRSMNPEDRTLLPGQAFAGFSKRFETPTLLEGFQDIVEITFKFDGTASEQAIWTKYWT